MKTATTVYERIALNRILPAAVVPSSVHAVPLAKAILAGGLDIMEVTFRNKEAPRCVELINRDLGNKK